MAKKKGAGARDLLVVQSKLKDYIKGKDMMSGAEVVEAASRILYAKLDMAVKRAQENGRKTVRAHDL
ncbi:MAG: hypothetical protein HY722_08625 [Planctomycetes bacterium]|nr:hypothetical protein [Planctomycetota bacterium]